MAPVIKSFIPSVMKDRSYVSREDGWALKVVKEQKAECFLFSAHTRAALPIGSFTSPAGRPSVFQVLNLTAS